MNKLKTTVLIILDGFGIAGPNPGNPVNRRNMPYYFGLLKKHLHTELEASGTAVGLFKGQEGNSEAGHLNIGAGRVVKQDALYISEAISDGTFFKNNAFLQAIYHAKKYGTAAHLMGLLSNHNSAHSCPEHLYALLEFLRQQDIKEVYLHLFTDGRDSGQHDALEHLRKLKERFSGQEKIASVMGRLYGMDRNKNWERTEIAYNALVSGKGEKANSAEAAIAQAYNRGKTDEFIPPTVIIEKDKPVATIQKNDVIFFFNLRSDRARQIAKALTQPDFEAVNPGAFKRAWMPENTRFVALTDFGPDLPNMFTAYPSRDVENSLARALCPRRQLYIAESEKFAHITYFFNGGYAQHFCDERWVKIDSNVVDNYDADPAMKAAEIAEYVSKAVTGGEFEFIAVNLANADMIGHTGNLDAAVKALPVIDNALAKITRAVEKAGGCCVITADHGNIEEMINLKTKEVDTEHSVNLVPLILAAGKDDYRQWGLDGERAQLRKGKLADVAPTILKIMGIEKPKEMTGKALF